MAASGPSNGRQLVFGSQALSHELWWEKRQVAPPRDGDRTLLGGLQRSCELIKIEALQAVGKRERRTCLEHNIVRTVTIVPGVKESFLQQW
jgi:hypothetical protein